jgi:hypothetical protein
MEIAVSAAKARWTETRRKLLEELHFLYDEDGLLR